VDAVELVLVERVLGELFCQAGEDGFGLVLVAFAEFGYGGKLLPTFPKWLLDGSHPSRLAWLLKERILPPIYWQGMLKGREWLAAPHVNSPVS